MDTLSSMSGWTSHARYLYWAKDGQKHAAPDSSSFAAAVSRESNCIALIYDALINLEVKAADIPNAYLQAPTSEKHNIKFISKFSVENQGKRALISRVIC
ncbi:hypothetical protein ACHAWF_002984 [Thalassiosira exigua]